MQADRTGYDDGVPYVATLVGGWEMFQSAAAQCTWRQARASFTARAGEPFQPQIIGDHRLRRVTLPTPPPAGPDPGVLGCLGPGPVGYGAVGPAGTPAPPVVRNTGWVSVGITGFSHAPVVQVTVAQAAKPNVELISIAATFERLASTSRDETWLDTPQTRQLRSDNASVRCSRLCTRLQSTGRMGGLFAPAYIHGLPASENAVSTWQAENHPVTYGNIDQTRMPLPFQGPSAMSAGNGVYGGPIPLHAGVWGSARHSLILRRCVSWRRAASTTSTRDVMRSRSGLR